MGEDGVGDDGEGGDGAEDADGDGAGDVVPPGAVHAGVADYDEEAEGEAELEAAEGEEEVGLGEGGSGYHACDGVGVWGTLEKERGGREIGSIRTRKRGRAPRGIRSGGTLLVGDVVSQNKQHTKRGHSAGTRWVYKSKEASETQPCPSAYLSWAIFLEKPVRCLLQINFSCMHAGSSFETRRQTKCSKRVALGMLAALGDFNVGFERELIGCGGLARSLCLQWHSRPILHGLGFPVLPMGHGWSRRLAVSQSPRLHAVLPDMFFLSFHARFRHG